MFWLQFKYGTVESILSSLHPFLSLGGIGEGVLIALILIIVLSILFFIPFFLAGESYIFVEREKKKKKSMLKQIMTQKEIEDEVEREIQLEEQKRQDIQK